MGINHNELIEFEQDNYYELLTEFQAQKDNGYKGEFGEFVLEQYTNWMADRINDSNEYLDGDR